MVKNPSRLARSLRFVCDWLFGASLFGGLVWVIWILAFLFMRSPAHTTGIWVGLGPGPPGLSLPVEIDPGESAMFADAGLFNATGELRFTTGDRRFLILGILDDLVLWILILGLAFHTRQFLVDVIDGTPFTFDNARRLKWMGWLLLGVGVTMPVMRFLAGRWALSIVKIQNPALSPPIKVDAASILVAAFILILSAAFRHGVELEKERSLTV
jgi:hypothetical protein